MPGGEQKAKKPTVFTKFYRCIKLNKHKNLQYVKERLTLIKIPKH